MFGGGAERHDSAVQSGLQSCRRNIKAHRRMLKQSAKGIIPYRTDFFCDMVVNHNLLCAALWQ
jgi:hypothetical protein